MDASIFGLLALAIATCLVSGVFLTFSDFIMPSLSTARSTAGTEAMQVINRKVFHSVFMVMFLALVPITGGLAIFAATTLNGVIVLPLVWGGIFYVIGVFAVTGFGNVPMNNRLAEFPDGSAQAQGYWPSYVRNWTALNHIRTAAALAAAILYMMAAVLQAGA